LRAAHALLLTLNPKPGRGWAASMADYVIPEVLVRKVRGRWQAALNPAVMPRLRVSSFYERLLAQSAQAGRPQKQEVAAPDALSSGPTSLADREVKKAPTLESYVTQAHVLIKSVKQRFDTVLRVAQFIVEH